jgi:anionic cell wall polymer biosynthesis LytR-Cps2A-Psr (LCP) family protein
MSAGPPIPPYPPYPPPPPSSGNTVLKIVLIVAGILVTFGIIAAGVIGFGVYRFSRSIHKDGNGNVNITTANGSITTGTSANISIADLGTVPYPGATNVKEGSMNMKSSTGSVVTCVYTSTDPSTRIVDFYKEKLGNQASIAQSSHSTVLTAGEKGRDTVMVTVTPQDNLSKIMIMHVTSNKQ